MKQFSLESFFNGGKLEVKSPNQTQSQNSKGKSVKSTSKQNKSPNNKSKQINQTNQTIIEKRPVIIEDEEDTDLNKELIPKITKELKSEKKDINLHIDNKTNSLPFMSLIEVLLKVEKSKGENSKDAIKELLSNLFINIISNYPNDLPRAYYFLNSKVGPEYKSPEFGIGNGILERVVSKIIGISEKQLKAKKIEYGDLALIASEGKKTIQTMDSFANFIKSGPKKELTLYEVINIYKEIADKKGKSSQDEKSKLLSRLMFMANKDELKFIIRSLQKGLKIGASFKTIISALARAVAKINKCALTEKEINQIILESLMQLSDEDIVFTHMINLINNKNDIRELKKLCSIRPGIPVNPQLARPTTGINIVFARFEKIPFTCEYKYDGFRGQIHFHNGTTEIFSRNLENMTETYPDIVEYVQKFQKESEEKSGKKMTSFIIDCEMVAFDKEKNKILPFQDLTTRSRKNVDISTITIHVCMFVFDILYLNGEVVTNKTLRERRELLYSTFTENQYIQFAKNLISEDQNEIENFMGESVLSGCEGLIVKAIDKNSEYMPGQRNFNWLKLKKDYLETSIGDSIDLVVIGAQYGKGKRKGLYGSFLLACYNDDSETFESVTMTGGGLKDEDLDNVHKQLQEHIVPKAKSNYRIGDIVPDVYFEPFMVWEIKTADLTQSPIYLAGSGLTHNGRGISLRFPRFIRIRSDKKPEEACTSEYIVKLYNEQASITNNSKEMKAMEDLDDLY